MVNYSESIQNTIENEKLCIKKYISESIGFFLDCFDTFTLPYFVYYISTIYFSGNIPPIYDCLLRTATPIGSLITQLAFYSLKYKFKPFPNAGLIIILASLLGLCLSGTGKGIGFITCLIFWRLLLGIGITLENPVKFILNSKYLTPKPMMKLIYISFSLAIIMGFVISMVFALGFKNSFNINLLDIGWRLYEGILIIPTVIILYFRLVKPKEINNKEINRDELINGHRLSGATVLVTEEEQESEELQNFTWSESILHYLKPKNFVILLGNMYAMFATNLIFWGYAWNLGIVFNSIGYTNNSSIGNINFSVSVGVVIVAFGNLPGFLISTLLIDKIGRKNLQLIGFGGMSIIFSILGFCFFKIKNHSPLLLVWLMSIANFFVQFAPNCTSLFTFQSSVLSPANEPSPNGYLIAMRNFGLIASQFLFIYCKDIGGPSKFINYLFEIYALLALIGFLITFLLPNPQPF